MLRVPGLNLLERAPEQVLYGYLAGRALQGEVLVIDGGNSFDVYPLGEQARSLGADGGAVLGRTWVARAFTVHQMQTLVEETIPQWLARRRLAALAVTGFTDPYLDPDTTHREARVLVRRALSRLAGASRGSRVPFVLTADSPGTPRRRDFTALLQEAVAESFRFQRDARTGALRMLARSGGGWVLPRDSGALQRRLDDWAAPGEAA